VIPVYNEGSTLPWVLEAVREFWQGEVLVVDDGSIDATPQAARGPRVALVQHRENRGYGAALRSGFSWARERGFDWVITMDADRQHEPAYLPRFLERIRKTRADIVSGSRYLDPRLSQGPAPEDRRRINRIITQLLREITGYRITDAFCGFRACRLSAMAGLELAEDGYGFPVEFWIKAAHAGLRVEEIPVPLVYHDLQKGVGQRPPQERLAHYLEVAAEAIRWTCL